MGGVSDDWCSDLLWCSYAIWQRHGWLLVLWGVPLSLSLVPCRASFTVSVLHTHSTRLVTGDAGT